MEFDFQWLLLAVPLVVLVAKLLGLYDRDALLLNKTTLDEAPKLFQAATLYTLLLTINDSWLIQGELGARQAMGIWSSLFIMSVLGRTVARVVARQPDARGEHAQRVAGAGARAASPPPPRPLGSARTTW